MKRTESSFFYLENEEIRLLFSKMMLEKFEDQLFPVPTYEMRCEVLFKNDSVYLKEIRFEEDEQIAEKLIEYSISDLVSKNDSISLYLIDTP